MLAMVLERITPRPSRPLETRQVPDPVPRPGELLLRVLACAVRRAIAVRGVITVLRRPRAAV